jgi:Family of unknown function (DUF6345)
MSMGSVDVNRDNIRPFEGALPVFRLRERSRAGVDHVLELAGRVAANPEHRQLSDSVTGVYQDKRLVAFADAGTGEASMFPQLELLTPGEGLDERARAAAAELSENNELFPADRTSRQVLDPTVLRGSRASRRRTDEAAAYLALARIRRHVEGISVVGKGSQATVAVSADGVEAVSHNWRAADVVDELSGSDVDPGRVAELIVEDLRVAAEDKDIRVESVELVYHDGDQDFIQPVYRYRATYGGDGQPTGRLLGYVPAVRLYEELRVTVPVPTRLPKDALVKGRPRLRNNRPTIGRYVVRQDNAGWVTSANSFLSGLSASSLLNPSFAPVDRQYYWAEPRLFTDENHEFVDGVEVALTEVHGNWGLFTTLKNNADFVRLDGIPSDGYGGADGTGALAYWILHSCEVIPTSADSATSYDVWWNIFNGLHTALGYRTEMWINDEITSRFGFWAGLGAPMISNWLTTIINDDSYSPTDTYFDGNVNMTEPMGRPSAVTVFGHSDDTIFDTASLPRPSVLQQWWFDN